MMDPLRTQQASDDPADAQAARIVASARPPAPSTVAKARVLRAVFARLESPAPRRAWRLSYAALGLLLFGGAAAASVTWAVVRWVQSPPAVREPVGAALMPASEHPLRALGRGTGAASGEPPLLVHDGLISPPDALGADVDALLVPSPPTHLALPSLDIPRTPRRKLQVRAKPPVLARVAAAPRVDVEAIAAPMPAHAVAPLPPPPEADADERAELRLLHEAYRALRVQARPAHALSLLRQHLRVHADSALREEVLGLAIEACAAMGEPEAASFALVYVRDFPAGRFRAAAERAMRRFAP